MTHDKSASIRSDMSVLATRKHGADFEGRRREAKWKRNRHKPVLFVSTPEKEGFVRGALGKRVQPLRRAGIKNRLRFSVSRHRADSI